MSASLNASMDGAFLPALAHCAESMLALAHSAPATWGFAIEVCEPTAARIDRQAAALRGSELEQMYARHGLPAALWCYMWATTSAFLGKERVFESHVCPWREPWPGKQPQSDHGGPCANDLASDPGLSSAVPLPQRNPLFLHDPGGVAHGALPAYVLGCAECTLLGKQLGSPRHARSDHGVDLHPLGIFLADQLAAHAAKGAEAAQLDEAVDALASFYSDELVHGFVQRSIGLPAHVSRIAQPSEWIVRVCTRLATTLNATTCARAPPSCLALAQRECAHAAGHGLFERTRHVQHAVSHCHGVEFATLSEQLDHRAVRGLAWAQMCSDGVFHSWMSSLPSALRLRPGQVGNATAAGGAPTAVATAPSGGASDGLDVRVSPNASELCALGAHGSSRHAVHDVRVVLEGAWRAVCGRATGVAVYEQRLKRAHKVLQKARSSEAAGAGAAPFGAAVLTHVCVGEAPADLAELLAAVGPSVAAGGWGFTVADTRH